MPGSTVTYRGLDSMDAERVINALRKVTNYFAV